MPRHDIVTTLSKYFRESRGFFICFTQNDYYTNCLCEKKKEKTSLFQANTQRHNNIVSTSSRRHDTTLLRRCRKYFRESLGLRDNESLLHFTSVLRKMTFIQEHLYFKQTHNAITTSYRCCRDATTRHDIVMTLCAHWVIFNGVPIDDDFLWWFSLHIV